MTYRDELLTCKRCGKQFVYRVEEQRLAAEMGLEPEKPEYCPACRETMEPQTGPRPGVVKWYRDDKHFGFIKQENGHDIFFHRSNFEGDVSLLTEETPVWYEIVETDRGPQAVNVRLRES